MKRGKKMVLLLIVLALMVGGYFGVQQINQKDSVSETAGTFDLTARTQEEMTGLEWTKDNVTQSFKYENGTWVTADEPSWPVDQAALDELAEQLLALQATRKLEDVKNEADYGLETPVMTVTAAYKDGTAATYSMGDATPFADGYYLKLSGQDGTIYTIATSLSSIFNKTQKDLAAMEEIPEVEDVSRLTVGSTFDAVKKETSITVDPDQLWYDAKDTPLEGTKVESLIASMKGIAWNALVTANADEDSLTAWQLDDEGATPIALRGSGDTAVTVLVGTQDEEGNYYARLPGSSMVYTVKSSSVSSLLAASAADMGITALLPLPWDHLAEGSLVTEKGEYHLEGPAAEETDEAAAADGEADEEAGAAAQTGANETDQALWDRVVALKASGVADTEEAGNAVLTISAVSTEGIGTTVLIMEYSADAYLAKVDGGRMMTVDAADVDALVRLVNSVR